MLLNVKRSLPRLDSVDRCQNGQKDKKIEKPKTLKQTESVFLVWCTSRGILIYSAAGSTAYLSTAWIDILAQKTSLLRPKLSSILELPNRMPSYLYRLLISCEL